MQDKAHPTNARIPSPSRWARSQWAWSRWNSRMKTGSRLLVLTIPLLTVGCADIFGRQETIGFAAGDAVAANKVQQVIDPWDERASWTEIDQDGNRAAAAVDTYRSGESATSETVSDATPQTQ